MICLDLWIRSQDKKLLLKAETIEIANRLFGDVLSFAIVNNGTYTLGVYDNLERALEVLNDISSKIKNQFIVEVAGLWRTEDVMNMRDTLKSNYDGEFIMETKPLKIKPINQNLFLYEMPQE